MIMGWKGGNQIKVDWGGGGREENEIFFFLIMKEKLKFCFCKWGGKFFCY